MKEQSKGLSDLDVIEITSKKFECLDQDIKPVHDLFVFELYCFKYLHCYNWILLFFVVLMNISIFWVCKLMIASFDNAC